MTHTDAEFLRQLRAAFHVEAGEHLQAISSGLLELEKAQEVERRAEIVATVFRAAHSLKGAARAVNLEYVEAVCQGLEGVLAAWRRQDVRPSAKLLDLLHDAVRAVEGLLPAADGAPVRPSPQEPEQDAGSTLLLLLRKLADLETAWGAPDAADQSAGSASALAKPTLLQPPVPELPLGAEAPALSAPAPVESAAPRDEPGHRQGPPVKHALADTLRVSTAKLDALLLQAEEMLAVKLTAAQHVVDVRAIMGILDAREKEWARFLSDFRGERTSASARGPLPASPSSGTGASDAVLMRFIEWNQEHARTLHDRLSALMKAVDHERRVTAGMVDTLLESSKKLLMLPASTLLEMCPRLVRELSRELGKEIGLTVRGGEVEVDKRILEGMKDPLVHLLRNAVDHGIEPAEKRAQQHKPPAGTIAVTVAGTEGNKVEIVIGDDGGGIDAARVRSAAVRRGVISQEDAGRLGERESLGLIFRPDVSTSPIITEISGRGLGMDIVKSEVERLGGRVDLETRIGVGTTFRLLLPLTLATFRGILVRSADQLFVVPTTSVDCVVRMKPQDIRTVENRETLKLNDKAISYVRLSDVLELPRVTPDKSAGTWAPVVVLASGGKRIAFQVDAVVNEQEVLVKPLGMPLARVRNISAATVLGTGKAVPILNVEDLMKSAALGRAAAARAPAAAAPAQSARIIVAEDSITARMLLKNILESAGHRVKTAVDGLDALTALKTENFDLVVSDVEMPRMDGFELTAKIRADARLAELPVILVTALSSREHRERGVDVGADAYIVKGSFDQSDLLDAVRRLL